MTERSTDFENVIYEERKDKIATILLDRREKRNAFNTQLYDEVRHALESAASSEAVRVAVLGSTSDKFSAGADIGEWAEGLTLSSDGEPHGFMPFVDALSTFSKPLVGAVEGYAVGIGATLLLHCDFVVMASDARLRMPFAPLSIAPEAASSVLLPMAVGRTMAREMLLIGDWISAERLFEAGFVYRLADSGKALETAIDVARTLAAHPGRVLQRIKRLLIEAESDAVRAARAREDAANAASFGQPEFQEAVRAFMEKREVDYSGFP
jgi:enoyl-CoA hydratase/carnithine racemase